MTVLRIPLRFLSVAVVTVGCGHPAAERPSPPKLMVVSPAPAPVPLSAPILAADFEAALDDRWTVDGDGYRASVDTTHARSGRQSLRIERTGEGKGSTASLSLPIESLRGKRVRVRAWLRGAAIADGWAGVWVGSGQWPADDSHAMSLVGDSDWREHEAEILVPSSASEVRVGVKLAAAGTAWFDDLLVEVLPPATDAELARPVRVEGQVIDRDGKALAGMYITMQAPTASTPIASTTSDPQGRFAFDVLPAMYLLSASSPTVTGGAIEDVAVPPGRPRSGVRIVAGGPGAVITGRVLHGDEPVAGAWAGVAALRNARAYAIPTDEQGRYRLTVPDEDVMPAVFDDRYRTYPVPTSFRPSAQGSADIRVIATSELFERAPESIVAALRDRAVPLATVEPGRPYDDLRALRGIIGDARIVGLGEATHGTREFFQLKHRVFEYLVAELGFTVFAIESSLPAAEAVNDYILTGKGDPKQALAGMHFWIYNTEEVLALIEWMRAWNSDPAHRRKVSFYGVDMQFSSDGASRVVAYLDTVDQASAAAAREILAPVLTLPAATAFTQAPAEKLRALQAALVPLAARFDRHRRRWSAKAGRRAWVVARRHLRTIEQDMEMTLASGFASSAVRDRAMAENARWIVEEAEPGARAMVWAHNSHVGRHHDFGIRWMGDHLAGRDYVTIGFAFGQGGFRTRLVLEASTIGTATVGSPPEGSLDATLLRVGMPLFAVDLRDPRGDLAAWLAAPRISRQIGSHFDSDLGMHRLAATAGRHDALIYVDTTTPSRPSDVPPVR